MSEFNALSKSREAPDPKSERQAPPQLAAGGPGESWASFYKQSKAAFASMSEIDRRNVNDLVDSLLKNDPAKTQEAVCRYSGKPKDLVDALPSVEAVMKDKLDPENKKASLDDLGWQLGAGSPERGRDHAFLQVLQPGKSEDSKFDTDYCSPLTS